jgi:hypothetical protein
MRKVPMAPPRRAAQGALATRKVPMVVSHTAVPPAPRAARMARRLCAAPYGGAAAVGPYGGAAYLAPYNGSPVYAGAVVRPWVAAPYHGSVRRRRPAWHDDRCHEATPPPSPALCWFWLSQAHTHGLLGLLCLIGHEIQSPNGLFIRRRTSGCQIASNSDPHFVSNLDPSSGTA